MAYHRKVSVLIRMAEEEHLELEHLYSLLKVTVQPEGPIRKEAKVRAMQALDKSKNYLNDAIQRLHNLKDAPLEDS